MNTNLLEEIRERQEKLQLKKPFETDTKRRLDNFLKLEYIFNSLAISNNNLTKSEIIKLTNNSLVIDDKNLIVQQKALNLNQAYEEIKKMAQKKEELLSTSNLDRLYLTLTKGLSKNNQAKYRDQTKKVPGSKRNFPGPDKIPNLIEAYLAWFNNKSPKNSLKQTLNVHYGISLIQPYPQANDQLSRLIASYHLIRNGYPPLIIKKDNKSDYQKSLKKAHQNNFTSLQRLIYQAILANIKSCLNLIDSEQEKQIYPLAVNRKSLLKIGQLANKTGETVPTIRHWTKKTLLKPVGETKGGFMLYSKDSIRQAKRIRSLQKNRLTLEEIKVIFDQED